MVLIIIVGRPCSGKSTFARALVAAIDGAALVSEEALGGGNAFGGDRARAFASPASEKVSRARLKAAVERALTHPRAVVVADGGNGVKGFRYELHVLARNARTPSVCVWVGPDVTLAAAVAINATRSAVTGSAATPYAEGSLRDLWARFEAPDARNKWDSPLVRVPLVRHAAPAAAGSAGARVARLLLDAAASVQFASAAAAAVIGGAAEGDDGSAWWHAQVQATGGAGGTSEALSPLHASPHLGLRADGHSGSGPFLTSRFSLGAVHSSDSLAAAAAARGAAIGSTVPSDAASVMSAAGDAALATAAAAAAAAGASATSHGIAEAFGKSGRRAVRQHADAAAWLGAVPREGFSARANKGGARVATSNAPPNYYAADFNGDDNDDDAEEGEGSGASDVGDLRDLEAWREVGGVEEGQGEEVPLQHTGVGGAAAAAGGSSFRRAAARGGGASGSGGSVIGVAPLLGGVILDSGGAGVEADLSLPPLQDVVAYLCGLVTASVK